jgi:hypothetical protein
MAHRVSVRWVIAAVLVLVAFVSAAAGRAVREDGTANVFSTLFGVSCVSTSDCWAVGWYSPPGTGTLTEALHWDGHSWTRASTPNPGGTANGDQNGLVNVVCLSMADCWADGASDAPRGGGSKNLLLHWDGSQWSLEPLPALKGSLGGISCPSASDCWILAGSHQALRWNGSTWSVVTLPGKAEPQAVTCLSASNCWAVGSRRTGTARMPSYEDSTLHWNGSQWAPVPVPKPGPTGRFTEARLSAVACTSSASCLAVGDYTPPSLVHLDQAAHLNGFRWANVTSKLPDNRKYHPNWLDGVACISRSDCWAVGAFGKSQAHLNQIQHWNGNGWSLAHAPEPGGTTGGDANVLDGVFCLSASDCWAVGWSQTAGKPNVNEILHWNGRRWSTG